MPYSTVADLPPAVRKRYSGRCLEVYREVFNKTHAAHPGDESRAFATAATAANRCKAAKATEESTVGDLSMSEKQEAIRNALMKRLGGSRNLYIAEAYDDRVVYTTYSDDQPSKSFEVDYSMSDSGDVTLGEEATEVERRTVFRAVKFADDSTDILEGLAIPFGRIKGKDLDGEDFGPDTDYCLDWYDTRPLLYHHGLNKTIKTAVVGRQVEADTHEEGIWVKTELDKRSRWRSRVQTLVEKEALGFSSGAMGHLATATKSGHITRWPWVELSLTPTNAHPGAALAYAIKTATPFLSDDVEEGSDDGPYGDHGERVLADVAMFLDRADDRAEARIKVGRELSAANRETLRELDSQLAAWAADLSSRRKRISELLDRTDPITKKAIEDLEAELLVSELRRTGVLTDMEAPAQ